VKTLYAMYDHSQKNNPNSVDRQLIGTATFIKSDDMGRWYEFEIKRSHAYHDYVLKLVESGVLGASSGTFAGAKSLDPEILGRISRWVPGEGSLCVTPAAYQTVGRITVKSVEEDVVDIVNDAIKTYQMPLPLFKTAAEQIVATEILKTEVVVEETPAPQETLAKEIEEILGTEEITVVEEESEAQKSLNARLDKLEKMMNICIEAFGDVEEIKESLAGLGEILSSVKETDSMIKDLGSSFKTLAAYMKTMKVAFLLNDP